MRAALAALLVASPAAAGDVEILGATATRTGETWRVSVTLRHADTGWEHYADAWRLLAPDGTVLGTRILHHPHVEEQPFTRTLSGVSVPEGTAVLRVEARDTVHGWSPDRLDLPLPD